MSEKAGLHVELTADSGNFSSKLDNARRQLAEFAVEQRKLNTAIQAAEKELAQQSQKFGKDSEEAEKAAKALEQLYKENIDLKAKVDATTKEINQQTQAFAKNAKQGNDTANQLKSAFTMLKGVALGYAGKTLFSALIGSNAEFEQSMTSFEVLLGSADKADKLLNDLNDFGAATPFELPELTESTTQLLAFGTAEEDVMTKLQQLGDLSMGNAEKLGRLTNAYGKMLAKGKVSLEELNMFTEAGVPILEELQKQYGVTQEKLFDMISAGKINIDGINTAMESMTSQGGKFFGMMEKQSQTMSGLFSTMTDTVNIFARQVGEESFEYLKGEMASLMAEIDRMSASGELQAIAEDIGADVAGAVKLAGNLLKILFDMKDVIIAGTAGVVTYKASFALLTTGVSAFNAVKETFNIITGKSVVVKNLETGATTTLTAAEAAEVTAKNASIVAQTKLNAVMNANPVMAVVSAVAAVVSILVVFNKTSDNSVNATRKIIKELDSMAESYENLKQTVEDTTQSELAKLKVTKDTIPRLEELANKTDRTAEEEAEFKRIIDGLNEAMPDLKLAIDAETGALNMQIATIWRAVGAYEALAKAKALEELTIEAEKNKAVAQKYYNDNIEQWQSDYNNNPGLNENFVVQAFTGWYTAGKSNAAYNALEAMGKAQDEINKYEEEANDYRTQWEALEEEAAKAMDEVEKARTDGGDTPGSTYSGSSGGTSKTTDPLKETKEAAKNALDAMDKAHEDWMKDAESYISQRNFYGDWEKFNDSEEEALDRMWGKIESDHIDRQEKLKEYYDDQLLTQEEYQEASEELYLSYSEELEDVGQRQFTIAKEQFEAFLDANAETLKKYYQMNKMFDQAVVHTEMEAEISDAEEKLAKVKRKYSAAQESIERQMQELDEKLAAFERAIEEDDDEERRQRLAYSLEYEHDEDNKRALEKELAELDKEIAEKKFRREAAEKLAAYEEEQRRAEELYEQEVGYMEELLEARKSKEEKYIEEIEAKYEQAMSMENITQEMYNYLAQNGGVAEGIGALMGEQMVDGLSKQLEGYLAAVEQRMEEYGLNPNGSLSRSLADKIVNQNNSRSYNLTINSQGGGSSIIQSGKRLMDEIELRSNL